MGLDQLYSLRPTTLTSTYKTPLNGLFMCGSSVHPGGGVMGAAGCSSAGVVIDTERARVEAERKARHSETKAKRLSVKEASH